MKKLLLISLLLTIGVLASGQTNLPPCDPNNVPPNCTDYFGVANWANSPLPAGTITGFTVLLGGSGYVNPQVVITDTTGTGATATATQTAGVITSAVGTGTNYTMPQVTIVDVGAGGTLANPTCGVVAQPVCGSGAMATAIIGAPFTAGTGMPKFQDALPNLEGALANPDITTFPGSDFYIIGLVEYTARMHANLPMTKLRGYCQLATPSSPASSCSPSYLGPVILAQKNRPVRVLFKNLLPVGSGGNLFIPVDTTYMGAGPPYTQNRATLHLHGGATPWISDGTPHQWTTPAGEAGPARGDSTQFVPDMWFNASGNLVAAGTAGATNDPGAGAMTFFWTNQQGGRLMFYHDHAYGITRLNVYAGEAAGYLLYDPVEEAALLNASVPGTIATNAVQTAPDLAHLIPLVIQDKTFVPGAAQLAAEDPTWTAGGFGTTPGLANEGDLWFPHVYTPNQNPADAGGANAFGRWDYGPWTLPGNQTLLLAANPQSAVDVTCTSSAFPNATVQCPITPNPSGTPEGFMDTPLVNGKAYPVLHVAPEAYRFQILSAGNDRSWNLQLYLGDPAGYKNGLYPTEVKMVPAIQPAAGAAVPLCSALTPITNTTLFMGLATGILDATTGNPINGTGLPAGCWPNFGAGSQSAGIPVQQTMWAADGRAGGAPDPTMAGPPFIQIGTEGGLLPAPVVIPSMPTGYEANTRSVTITNVSVHGLWLGPAERADVIVDFSSAQALCAAKGVNPCTLILYNDAPTPAPAVDSRLDYFTGDGDQTAIGGAPNTIPGYGPNTRTVMQIVVDQPATSATKFTLASLTSALPAIFKQTQPAPIVPEPTYPPASGGYSPTPTYSLITDANLTWFPIGSTTPVTYTDERKTIQELFTLDYGRMNATLGVELPLTNFLTQTTIPLGYIDPVTEVINQGDTQLWHITHNGVDTHFIHFHLFNVQVINRSAWDGTKRPPDPNELGWKDTVRMNPLEDILVALQPIQPLPPFPIRDSYRLLDVTMNPGSDCPAPANTGSPLPCSIFTNVDPVTNIGIQTPNEIKNFGWEYVWHCHILGHEENDMMRAIAFNVPPEAPSNLTVAAAVSPQTGLNLSWTDNSASETGFTLQRASDAGFTANLATITVPPIAGSTDTNGQGITWGGTVSSSDGGATTPPYFYRVQAFKPLASYWSNGVVTSAWSNTVSIGGSSVSVSPSALNFGIVALNTTSLPQTVTLSNTGNAPVTYSNAILGGDFVSTDPCGGNLAGNSTCTIAVTFTPTVNPPAFESATLTITTNPPTAPALIVSLSGTGGGNPLLTITASNATMRYGSAVPVINPSYSPANPTLITPPSCTTTALKTSPVANYPSSCSGAVGSYTFNYVAGTVSVTPAPLTIFGPAITMGVGLIPLNFTPIPTAADYVGFVNGDTSVSLTTQPTCTTTATNASPVGVYPITCIGAVDPNYTIKYAAGTLTLKPVLTITAPSPSMPYAGPLPATLTPTYNPANPVGLTTQPTCSTTATIASPVGQYPVTCSGAVDANYVIVYVAGTLTVTPVPLVITAGSATVAYGSAVPNLTTTFATFLNGDTVASLGPAFACTTTYIQGSSVSGGPYPSTCSGAVNANYSPITYVAGTVTVTPAPLIITAGSATVAYGAPVPTLTTTFATFLNNDTAASLGAGFACTTTYKQGSPVSGSPYPSTCSGAVSANYSITYVAGTVTVTAVPLTITAGSATITYGSPVPLITPTVVGLVNGDTTASLVGLTCTTTYVQGNAVGTYPTNCSGATNANYAPITYVAGAVTVTPALASVTPNAAGKVYGAADPVLTGTLTGFLPADGVTATYSRTAGEAVGSYVISAVLAPAAVLGNYTITYNTAPFTITKATASVTPNAASKVYGAADPVLTGTLTGFLPADGVTATYSRTTGEAVGSYVISAVLAPAAVLGNYTITYNTAAFTITPLAASVTPNAASKAYGSADPALNGALSGFLPADGVTATYSRVAGENVGTYTISATLAPAGVLGNYTITYNTAAFTITPLAASVMPNPASKVYGQADPALTGTLVGFLAKDNVTATYTRVAGANVGTYAISATLAPAAVLANYAITYNTALFTITKATTTTTITSHLPNPSAANQPVVVNFTVTPQFGGAVTGNVTVSSSTGESCPGAAVTGSCSITLVTPGVKTLTATYAGDTNLLGSASAGVSHVVASPVAFVSPTSLPFANQLVNTTSGILTATLQNLGNATLTINSIVASPAVFTRTTTCGATLAAGRSCNINVRFRPTSATAFNGLVTISSNDPVNPSLTVTLTGTGIAPRASLGTLSPSPILSTRGCTTACGTGTVPLTNAGTAPLTIASITIGGGSAAQFSQTNNCGTSLAAGGNCTVTVTFHPPAGTTRGTKNAALRVRDNSNGVANSLQTTPLQGTAQ